MSFAAPQESALQATRPIIRWAGSKRQLIPHLMKWVPTNYRRYVEPFAGSACLFFHLAPQSAVLGDINNELMKTYRQLRRHPTRLFSAVSAIPRTQREYYKRRAISPASLNAFDSAVRFLYLNRNCFNAVYRVNKNGEFNVPWGNRTGETPSLAQFRTCARLLRNAQLITTDFESLLAESKRGDFIYLDPPYTNSVADEPGLFGAGAFTRADMSRLIRALKRAEGRGATYLLSFEYDPSLIKELDGRAKIITAYRHVAGFSGARGKTRELLLTNAKEFS